MLKIVVSARFTKREQKAI